MKFTKEIILLEFLFPQYTHRELTTSRFQSFFQFESNSSRKFFEISTEKISNNEDKRTTILIQNLPTSMTKESLLEKLTDVGNINFLYLPYDRNNKKNFGFVYINFINYKNVIKAYSKFNGVFFEDYNMKIPLSVTYSRVQGKAKLTKMFSKKN